MNGPDPESDDLEPRMFHALRRLLQARNAPPAPAPAAPEKPDGWWEEQTGDPDLGPGWNGSIGR